MCRFEGEEKRASFKLTISSDFVPCFLSGKQQKKKNLSPTSSYNTHRHTGALGDISWWGGEASNRARKVDFRTRSVRVGVWDLKE